MVAEGYIDEYGIDEWEDHLGEGRCFGCGGWKGRKTRRWRNILIHGSRRSEPRCPNVNTDGKSGIKKIQTEGYIEEKKEDVPFVKFLR